MTDPNFFTKQPSEQTTRAFEYANRLPFSATLSSATLTAYNLSTQATDTSVLESTTGTVSGTQVRFRAKAGTNGVNYKITCYATLSNGDILEDDVEMRVADL